MTAPQTAFARKRQRAQNAILEAASQVIAEKGIDGLTISEVAKRARINRALVYHYFGSREHLIAQTIEHIFHQYEPLTLDAGIDALERSTRLHIEHPEIARFFFQTLLHGQPLPGFDHRIRQAIAEVEELKRRYAPDSALDPTFAVIIFLLAQLAWAFSRQELARLLDISLDEADRRFIDQLKRVVQRRMERVAHEGAPSTA